MSSVEPELEVLYKIGNTQVREFPFPHIYVPEVFPAGFFAELRRNLPPQETLRTLGELGRVTGGDGYPERGVMPLTPRNLEALQGGPRAFWEGAAQWLLGPRFGNTVIGKFAPWLAQRLGDLRNVRFGWEPRIVRDRARYSLGPHTDAPSKALAFLFYLPPDESMAHLGTSIYVPRDPAFRCAGGPHYPFENFERMYTARYVPN